MAGYELGSPTYVFQLWKVGQHVQYLSRSNKQWWQTSLSKIHTDGTVEIALPNKAGTRFNYEAQCKQLRATIRFTDEDGTAHRIQGSGPDGLGSGLNWFKGESSESRKRMKLLEIKKGTNSITLTGPWGKYKIQNPPAGPDQTQLVRQLKVSAYASGVQVRVHQNAYDDVAPQQVIDVRPNWSPTLGMDLLYYSTKRSTWLPCKVIKLEGDNIELSIFPGELRPLAWLRPKIREANAEVAAFEEELPASSGTWKLAHKPGCFLCDTGSDDPTPKTKEECEAMVLNDPSTFSGYCVSNGFFCVRKTGAHLIQVDGWDSYLASCVAIKYTGQLFKDNYTESASFPEGLENGKGGTPHMYWKRPGRGEGLLDLGKISLYQLIEPHDLHQGSVGDCSLIAAIACLAEYPDSIKRLFGKRHQGKGMYEVILFDWGARRARSFLLDDRFACKTSDAAKPAFAQASEDVEIYPMLLEKAVAIMLGGYDFMSAIMPTWALGVLTGSDDVWLFSATPGVGWTGSKQIYDGTSSFQTCGVSYDQAWPDGESGQVAKTDLQLFQCLQRWDNEKYMMIAGCSAEGQSDASANPVGIIYVHAYSLLQVKINVAGSGKNLIQLRNPHGSGGREPNTRWKDHDPLWTQFPEVAKECMGTRGHQADGLFWMEEEEFFGPYNTNFNTVYLVKLAMPGRRSSAMK